MLCKSKFDWKKRRKGRNKKSVKWKEINSYFEKMEQKIWRWLCIDLKKKKKKEKRKEEENVGKAIVSYCEKEKKIEERKMTMIIREGRKIFRIIMTPLIWIVI